MHYIPVSPAQDDDDDSGSKASSVGRKSRRGSRSGRSRTSSRSRSRRRRKSKSVQPEQPPSITSRSSSTHHKKAAKKIRGLIARTFASHKPKPTAPRDLPMTEQDALLTVIHCQLPQSPNDGESDSFYSMTSNSNSHQQQQSSPWTKLRKSVINENNTIAESAAGKSPPAVNSWEDETSLIDNDENENDTPQERALRIQKAQDEIRAQMSFPLWICILAIGIYIILSVICFSFVLEKHWTLIDSSYFAVVTFTTIGYGDMVPDTPEARMFTCIWALSGVASLGIALGVLGSNLIVVHEKHMEQAQVQRQSRVIGLFDHHLEDGENEESTIGSYGHSTIEEGKRRVMFDHMEDSDDEDNPRARQKNTVPCWKRCCCSAACVRWTLLTGYIAGILYLIANKEGWNFSKTIYYAIITAATVGYGDFSPQTEWGRLLAVFFIPVAVGIMGCFLERVANGIIDGHRNKYARKLHEKPLTLEDLRILDSDGDGEVCRAEFLEFMLVAMNEVDKNLLDRLKEHFQRLDVDGSGTITKADLAEMARRRLTHDYVEEKLRLARYKDYLLQQAHKGVSNKSPRGSAANLQKPTLERRTTQPTSNRTTATTETASSLSYQHQTYVPYKA